MRPFSDHVVFVDTEFTDLDARAELLSIGLVKPNGDELYVELESEQPPSTFCIEHVLPHLSGQAVSVEEAKRQIRAFVGEEKPYLVGWVPHYDMVLLLQLFGVSTFPWYWHAIDLASILFGEGRNPESYRRASGYELATELGMDPSAYQLHRSVDDARFLKDVWIRLAAQGYVGT